MKPILRNIRKVFSIFISEFSAIFKALIIGYPNSYIGNKIRIAYWSRQYGIHNAHYFGCKSNIICNDKLHVGKEFILGDGSILEIAESYGCYIGDYVGIARSSYIRSANHNTEKIDLPILNQGHSAKSITYLDEQYSVVIEDNVWIGASCILLSGTHIGKGSVISAGSVVSSIIPEFSIVAGNPARVIGNRIKLATYKSEINNV
ncbi:MAG: acyltransferase [Bacteroidia bacterium]|nr:acyltransferase [Bacteroidia bacterium]